MFNCDFGKFIDKDKKTVDKLKSWSLEYFKEDLQKEPSLHKYVKKLPPNIIEEIDKLRYSTEIKSKIRKQYKKCNIIPLDEIDEIYISHVNLDNGGDQGLFDKHYDGSLRFINNATTIRVLIYLSSSGDLKVVFDDCKKEKNFKQYDYGILDFHREYHWVEGTNNPNDEPRILLKCNYLICEDCNSYYSHLIKYINIYIFYIVKACMEYSKSPKNSFQKIIGFFCNFFRIINIYSPIISMLLGMVFLILIILIPIYSIKSIIKQINMKPIKIKRK